MSERPVYLDIGIGKGGAYIEKDPPGTMRIGMDRYSTIFASGLLRQNYNVPPIRADGSGENYPFPFSSGSIDHIEVILPHDELLYGLCLSPFLWKEFYRVLRGSGDILIVVDEPAMGIQGVRMHGEQVFISSPHTEIVIEANDGGFKTEVASFDPSQTRELGTPYAQSAARWQEEMVPSEVYAIRASKTPAPR